MKRFYPYLASLALLVATAAGAYVIKDTANPVDIYTGSNTTPTIRAATSGAVTLGITSGSGLQHSVQSNGGTEFAVKSNNATGSVYMSLNPQTNTPKAFIGVNGASGDLGAGTGGAGDFVIRTESEPIQFSLDSGTTNHGNIATSGAWTLGQSGFSGTHLIRGTTQLNVQTSACTNANVCSGTYTPSLTNVTNIAASTAYTNQWMRVGSVVTVSGRVDIDPTAASTGTTLRFTLPVGSSLTASTQVSGVAVNASGSGALYTEGPYIYADAANDEALLSFTTSTTDNRGYIYTFTFLVL